MKRGRAILIAAAMCSLVSVSAIAAGNGQDGDQDKKVEKDIVIEFGEPQPHAIPNGPASHIVKPDEAFVSEGGTVTFNVNGTGHGIAIYPVSRNTNRDDIAQDLCQGGPTLCNDLAGTQNVAYHIIDGQHHLIIETDTGENQPSIDDPFHRYLSTSGTDPEDQPQTPSELLTGSASTLTPGNRVQIRFTKPGRYLVVCQNRGHLLNDWMFGFVNVVGSDGEQK